MIFRVRRAMALACALSLAMGQALHAQAAFKTLPRLPAKPSARYVEGEILVTYRPSVTAASSVLQAERLGGKADRILRRRRGPLIRRVRLPPGQRVEDALKTYAAQPEVSGVQPNFLYHFFEVDDPFFDDLWGLRNIGQTGGTFDADIDADTAWDMVPSTAVPIVVAVSDTGVDIAHEDLAAMVWINPDETAGNGIDDDNNGYVDDVNGWDFFDDDNDPVNLGNPADPYATYAHGTHVAGTVGAEGNNGIGVVGVSRTARLMPLKISDENGVFPPTTVQIVEAIDYAVANEARVINASWGGSGYDPALYAAIDGARLAGVLFVAAAGNGGEDGIGDNNDGGDPVYPASFNLPNIISVAATDDNDGLASFSNYGLISVDVGAPGVDILSSVPTNLFDPAYGFGSGTSMATPHVAGLAAMIWSAYPGKSYTQVRSYILAGVDQKASLDGRVFSGGRINATRSLALAAGGGGSTPASFPDIALYPNPFLPGQYGHDVIYFENLSPGSVVEIYSASGEHVRSLSANPDGIAPWDGRSSNGNALPSGTYLCVATGAGGNRQVLKSVIQR